MSKKISPLDDYDLNLLRRLQKNSRISAETLALEIGLSKAAVQRRLKRMRDEKVILRDVSVIDPIRLGLNMTFIVSIEMEREHADILNDFKRKLVDHPHVQQCYYVTGSADFFLVMIAQDMQQFEQITQQLFSQNKNVKSFNTSISMGKNKSTLELPFVVS